MNTRQRWLLAAAMAATGPAMLLAGTAIFATMSEGVGDGIAVAGMLAGFPLSTAAVALVLWWARAAICLRVAMAALPLFVAGVVLHNLVFGLVGVEEGVFFLLALLGAPAMFAGGLAAAAHAAWRTPRGGGRPLAHA